MCWCAVKKLLTHSRPHSCSREIVGARTVDYLSEVYCRSFAPFWQVMKTFAEKLSNLHQQLMMSWQELMRDVHKYSTEQQKKHREVTLTTRWVSETQNLLNFLCKFCVLPKLTYYLFFYSQLYICDSFFIVAKCPWLYPHLFMQYHSVVRCWIA